MKRGLIIANLLVSILVVSILLFYSFSGITGNVVFTPSIPTSCSDASIKSTWDSIFKENSTGITILTNGTILNGQCKEYAAYKMRENATYLLHGERRISSYYNRTEIMGIVLKCSEIKREACKALLLSSISIKDLEYFLIYTMSDEENIEKRNISLNITSASAEFSRFFKEIPENMTSYSGESAYLFSKLVNSIANNITLENKSAGAIYSNLSVSYHQISLSEEISQVYIPSICAQNWTAYNTSCNVNDKITTYYSDRNYCMNNTGKPESFTSPCDYDSNGIIGNLTTLTSRIGLSLYSNLSLLNLSANYSKKSQLVQFKSGDIVRVEFNWNFSQPLNLDNINIEKQSSSDTRGYILVKGIPASKKVFVDRIANYSKVCAKNSELSSISDLSQNCDDSGEIILDCPETISGISCSISGNFFQVERLTSSAVREFQATNNCAQNWNCTAWSACISKIQTRTCADRNNCNNLSGKPITNQSCVMPPPPCTSNWNCSEWMPEKCPRNGTRYQICNDKNLCNSTSNNKKTETQVCEYKSSSLFIIILAVIVILIITVASLIVYFLNKKPSQVFQEKPVTQYGFRSTQGY